VPAAHVRLRPHDEDDRVHLRGYAPTLESDAARTLFDRKGISTHQSGERLHIFGESLSDGVDEWRWRHQQQTAVHFDVRLPPDLDVTTQTPGGALDASGLTGHVDGTVQGGSIEVSRLEGPFRVRGGGGALTIQHCNTPSLEVRWAAGPVTLKDVTSAETTLRAAAAPTTVHTLHGPAELQVDGAALTLRDVPGPCQADVRGGRLSYHGAPTHESTLRTVGGPLQTHLPSAQAALLRLSGADVTLDKTFSFNGERTARRIEGTLNGGGPLLDFRAVQGAASCYAAEPSA
jgi:hypothetical protein